MTARNMEVSAPITIRSRVFSGESRGAQNQTLSELLHATLNTIVQANDPQSGEQRECAERRPFMLKLEISLPDPCHERSKVIDICAELGDEILSIRIRLCAHCETPFVPVRKNHRLCYRPRCRDEFYRAVAQSMGTGPSNR